MLLYWKILKLAGLSHFLAYFEPRKKQLLALKIEAMELDKILNLARKKNPNNW